MLNQRLIIKPVLLYHIPSYPGPQPNWDPDIVAALEEAEINEGINTGDLDDDFVLQANAGEPGLPVFVSENLR